MNNKSDTVLRKRATKEFGLRSKGFVAYDLDPDRSRGNHSGGTDLFFFLKVVTRSHSRNDDVYVRKEITLLVARRQTGFVENCIRIDLPRLCRLKLEIYSRIKFLV